MSSELINYFVNGKDINIICFCKEKLWGNNICIIEPCEHLVHDSCCDKIKDNCPLCQKKITNICTEKELMTRIKNNRNFINWQQYIDILGTKGFECKGHYSFYHFLTRFDGIIDTSGSFLSVNNYWDMRKVFDKMIDKVIKLEVIGEDNILNKTKITIANHTNYLDGYVMARIFDVNFKIGRAHV